MGVSMGERARGARSSAAAVLVALAVVLVMAPGPAEARPRRPAPRTQPRSDARLHTANDPAARQFASLLRELSQDRTAPRALVPLLEMVPLEGEVRDRAAIAATYRRVADDPAAHPEARALARFRLAALERAGGNLARAREEVARLGFLQDWSVVGPFDNTGKIGLEQVYPPERPHDPGARFPGKAREVGWRVLPAEATSLGFVHVGAALRPTREVVVYARTTVAAASARTLVLRLGTSGAVKVFVNGQLAHEDSAYHPARFDQQPVPVTLRVGQNEILLKLCHAEGRLGFYARLDDPPRSAPDALRTLERRAREAKGADAAQRQYDLAVVLAERRPNDENDLRPLDEARRAVELAPRSVRARLLAARLESDANQRRMHLEAAREADPRDVRVLTALAEEEARRGRAVPARRLLEEARSTAPGYVPARLALAQLWDRAGFPVRARSERQALVADVPWHAGALAAAAQSAPSAAEAIPLLRRALARRFDDVATRALLVQLLVDQGAVADAVAALNDALALAPADVDVRMQLAELQGANGRIDEAERAFAEALRIVPDEPEVLERRGQARLRNGRTADALADFGAAVALRPQNAPLKELIRALEPARERFEKPYLLALREEARRAPAAAADADAVVLGEVQVTRVFPSGLASRVRQIVVKVLTPRGVESWRSWSASYSPGRQELRVDRARVLKPDGAIVESHEETDRSLSEPWYRLYYDQRSRDLRFPALAPGDVLEIAIRTDDVAHENLLADSFGEQVFLANGTPKRRFDYVLLVPENRRIHASDPGAPRVVHETRTLADGVVEHRWTARDLPRLRSEPGMPGWSEVVPYVHVSTYESWDEVGRSYWALVREQLTPTRSVREQAARIAAEVRAERRAAGAPADGDELALVQAVHRFVVTNTRYVGLEFGIHGYKPYRVDQVLDRRFGDCKDKASLAHALLEALGIDARLVLLRMRQLGPVVERPASLAVFNHAILYVPRHRLWLDGTAAYTGTRELPAEDRGASVLVVEPAGESRLDTTPEGAPGENATSSRYEVALSPDGSAAIRGELRVAGVQAPAWRRAYASDAERRQQLEQAMARVFPGATVRSVAVSDLGRLEDDVVVRFSLSHATLAERDGDDLLIHPFGPPHRYTERVAPLSTREQDLVLGPPSEIRFSYQYELPAGMSPVALPPAVRLAGTLGSVDVTYRVEAGKLVAEASLITTASRVRVSEYPAFRDLIRQLDGALLRQVRLRRPGGAG